MQAPKDEIKPVALKATKTKKQQNQKRNQKTRQRQIRNIKSKLSKASNVLNKEINLPTLNFQPMTNALNGIAESSKETIGTVSNLIKNKSGQIASSIKKISATARERITKPIKINLPRIDVSLPRMPTSITNAVANGKKAIPGYLKSGLLATAVFGGSVISHAPIANTSIAKIGHAQEAMATSVMTKPLISSIPESAQQIGSASKPATPRAFGVSAAKKVLDDYSDEMAQRIVLNKKHNNKPFIVADPLTGTLSTYDTKGLRTGKYPALFGADQQSTSPGFVSMRGTKQEADFAQIMKSNMSDGCNWVTQNKARKIDPGIYEYRKVQLLHKSEYGDMGLQDKSIFGRINGSPGLGAAIHNTYLGNPIEKRMQRLKSESIADNFISAGCVNINSKDLQKSVLPKMEKDVPFIMAPYDKTSRGQYLGLSNGPMIDNTMTAEGVVNNMKPSSNSKSGELLDYFLMSIGRNSGSSEVFQGGAITKWTPNATGFNKMIDTTRGKIAKY